MIAVVSHSRPLRGRVGRCNPPSTAEWEECTPNTGEARANDSSIGESLLREGAIEPSSDVGFGDIALHQLHSDGSGRFSVLRYQQHAGGVLE